MSIEKAAKNIVRQLTKAYAKATELSIPTISGRVYGQQAFLAKFLAGKTSITVKKLDRLIANFHKAWPKDTPWPLGK